jgi:transglutaminase-like putative cysteine protease
MNKIFRFLGITFFCYFLFINPVFAEGEFKADYDVDYSIAPSGITIVTQKVVLTNRLPNLYPKQYSIILDTDKIRNIVAYDDGGQINPIINQKNGKTEIILKFNVQIVGLNKQIPFTLRFENTEIAQKLGSIWEVNIPGVIETKDLGDYVVSLETPANFGPNAYMTPLPASNHKWTKEQMVAGGISAAYGNKQTFSVKLIYFLENKNTLPNNAEFALPPDTPYQQVYVRSIDPKPDNVVIDSDNNWMARYLLNPKSQIKISADLIISTYLSPRSEYGSEIINNDDYLKPTKNWNSQFPSIATLGKEYITPRQIYDYVVKTLGYDYSRIDTNPIRKGASEALTNPKNSICMEFTDLFVGIARAAGIPARQAVGYAYTTNSKLRPLLLSSDILHSWPEYYDKDKQIWIPIDPTWANTTGGVNYFDKLDFNHIVFALNGQRDDYPYPAGAYRQSNSVGKNVDVSFAEILNFPNPKPDISILFPASVIAGIPAYGQIVLKNSTGVGINNIPIYITSNPPDLKTNRQVDHLPPFAEVNVPIQFSSHTFFSPNKATINITAGNVKESKNFAIQPLYVIITAIIIAFIISIFIVWGIIKMVQKHHQN